MVAGVDIAPSGDGGPAASVRKQGRPCRDPCSCDPVLAFCPHPPRLSSNPLGYTVYMDSIRAHARVATDDPSAAPEQSPAVYRPRGPAETVLHQVVAKHPETYLYLARQGGLDFNAVPEYVEREFRKYLTCGILAGGFAPAPVPGLQPRYADPIFR